MSRNFAYLVYTSGIRDRSGSREWGVKYGTGRLPVSWEAAAAGLSRQSLANHQITLLRLTTAAGPIYWIAQPGKDDLGRANIFGLLLWQDQTTPASSILQTEAAAMSPGQSQSLAQCLDTLRTELLEQEINPGRPVSWNPQALADLALAIPFVGPCSASSTPSANRTVQAATPAVMQTPTPGKFFGGSDKPWWLQKAAWLLAVLGVCGVVWLIWNICRMPKMAPGVLPKASQPLPANQLPTSTPPVPDHQKASGQPNNAKNFQKENEPAQTKSPPDQSKYLDFLPGNKTLSPLDAGEQNNMSGKPLGELQKELGAEKK